MLKKIKIGLKALYFINIRRNPEGFVPIMMSIKLTDRCNYRCITCNEYEIADKQKELPVEVWERAIRDFSKMGGYSVRFTGGEPFIRKKDLFRLITLSKKLGLRVAIATNGSLITDDDIEFLQKKLIDHITISIHGSEEVHNSIVRVKNSYKRLDNTVKKLKAAGLPVDIAFTVLKQNMKEINFIVEYAKNLNIKVGFNIFDNKLYFFKGIDDHLAPSVEEMKTVSCFLSQLKKRYPNHINGTVRAFKIIPELVQDSRLPYYYCARTLLEIFIDSFGNVMPGCWVMSPVGNIKKQSLIDIWKSEKYKKQRMKGFIKQCPGCTCGYELDVMLNLKRHKISKRI